MKKRSIVIFPDLPARETIAAIRRQFDPLYALVEPHITLVFSFESDLTDDEVAAAVDDVCRSFQPFSVKLDGVGVSDTYARIRIKDSAGKLRMLHDRLYAALPAGFFTG